MRATAAARIRDNGRFSNDGSEGRYQQTLVTVAVGIPPSAGLCIVQPDRTFGDLATLCCRVQGDPGRLLELCGKPRIAAIHFGLPAMRTRGIDIGLAVIPKEHLLRRHT